MRTAYIIHDPQDLPFVKRTLIPPLPSLGIDSWISSRHLDTGGLASSEQAMEASEAIIAVVSRSAAESPLVRREVAAALANKRIVIPVWIDDTTRQSFEALAALPCIDLREAPEDGSHLHYLRRELGVLLPTKAQAAR